jgi:dTDP-glucose pyrophosphorylase/predicted transcriptional regulator
MNKTKDSWKRVLITPDISIMSAIKRLSDEGMRILLVVDPEQHLIGVVTDGDIRRYILKQGNLELSVDQVMKKDPITASTLEDPEQLLIKMRNLKILHLPIVDDEKKVTGLETVESLSATNIRENWVIFMAGGMGKRLHPLTLDCPKPLLKVAGKPILEILLENFIKSGFKNFYFSVNYKAKMIQDYFGSGEKWGVTIRYIEEAEALGTAGALSLLPDMPEEPFFVVNADILTNMRFDYILDFHQNNPNKASATVCVRQYETMIPYGVVHINEQHQGLLEIEEKPTQISFVSAGIYVINPEVLDSLTFNSYCDMPALLLQLTKQDSYVATFPIREYWLDVGHHENLTQASDEYFEVFS